MTIYCHQIWVNTSCDQTDLKKCPDIPPPQKFSRSIENLKELCNQNGLIYKLWKNSDITDDLFPSRKLLKLFDSYDYAIQKIDLLKYLILNKYGGYYFDVDLDVINLPKFNKLTFGFQPRLNMGYENPVMEYLAKKFSFLPEKNVVNNNFMFCEAGDKFMQYLLQEIPKYKSRKPWELKSEYVFGSTGPVFLMQLIEKTPKRNYDLVNSSQIFHDKAENSWNKSLDTHDLKFFIFIGLLFFLVIIILKN